MSPGRRASVAMAFAVLAVTVAARAHAPGVLSAATPFEVSDASISRALYGTFETGAEVFVVRMTFTEDFALPMELMVPHKERLRTHRPAYAFLCPGTPAPSDAERAALPRPLPAGWGTFVDLGRVEPRPAFYESFTRRFFWTTGAVALRAPRGPCEVWIWSPARTTGAFAWGMGVEERIDVGEALADWGTYAY